MWICNNCGAKHIPLSKGTASARLYRIWGNMKSRCHKLTHNSYFLYGGRGIKVCDQWKSNFPAFRDWALQNNYNDALTIDRIDSNLGYSPSNCRWVDTKTQSRNKRNLKLTEADIPRVKRMYKNKLFNQIEIAEIYGVTAGHISHIVNGIRWK
jgi:hypothetical protein